MRLFKYYGEGEWVFTNLSKNQLYYNDFKNVNDPYECVINFKISTDWMDNTLQNINNGILEDPYFEINDCKKIDEVKEIFNNFGYELFDSISLSLRSIFIDMFGVSCFTLRNDSILMWGHYGNSFKGMCIEYEIPDILYPRLIKVKYDEIPITFNTDLPSVFESKHGIKDAKDIFSVKHSDWAYESEWRIVGDKNGIEKLPVDSIKRVFFGVKSQSEYREKVLNALETFKFIDYYNMKPTHNSYNIEFDKIDRSKAHIQIQEVDISELYDKLLD